MLTRAPLPLWDGHRARRTSHLIALIAVLSLCDLAFTVWAHQFMRSHEMNPVARMLLQGETLTPLIAGKLTLTFVGCAIFWRHRERAGTEVGVWMVAVAYVLLAIRWADYTTLLGGVVGM